MQEYQFLSLIIMASGNYTTSFNFFLNICSTKKLNSTNAPEYDPPLDCSRVDLNIYSP